MVSLAYQPHPLKKGITWSAGDISVLEWYPDSITRITPIITVGDLQYQRILGFGAAMTDTSAWLIFHSKQRDQIMKDLFDPKNGLGISLIRLPVGASDFIHSCEPYSYDDLPQGKSDVLLKGFSIAHDKEYIIPLLKKAIVLNPNLQIIASPWSPPGWMKTNNSLLGSYNGHAGTLRSEDYSVYAQYLVYFIKAYQQQGIPIYGLTIQNEPLSPVATYPGMIMSPVQEVRFISSFLIPALQKAGLRIKVLLYDQNWNTQTYVQELLKLSRNYNLNIAWHCYGGNPQLMTTIHTWFPNEEQYITECSTGSTGIAPMNAIQLLISTTQNWAGGVDLWNLALDQTGGPKIGKGCGGCTGLLTIYQNKYVLTDNYQELAQFSKFVKPGARRIYSSQEVAGLESVAFINPDTTHVLIVFNSKSAIHFKVSYHGMSFFYFLSPQKAVTFFW